MRVAQERNTPRLNDGSPKGGLKSGIISRTGGDPLRGLIGRPRLPKNAILIDRIKIMEPKSDTFMDLHRQCSPATSRKAAMQVCVGFGR